MNICRELIEVLCICTYIRLKRPTIFKFSSPVSLLGVGLLWGATNPFIRLGSAGIDNVDTGSWWRNLELEVRMISTRLHYWIPFLLNQLGSVLYVWTLQHVNIIVAVPVANSLSFAFTAITGYCLGEKLPGKCRRNE